MSDPVLALVGCGAIADAFYVPALEKRPRLLRSLILVDRDRKRTESLSKRLGGARVVTDHAEVLGSVDGAIIATPHHLHAPLTLDFVRHGAHVLSEKPLSATAREVDEIIESADAKSVTVSVNHTRRLFSSIQEAQRRVVGGEIGEVREFDCALGAAFGWPAATNTYFGTAAGGRGVLYDLGPHVLDLVCWFLGGEPELVRYADDSRGGTEAVAHVTMKLGAVSAHVHLSWLTELRNTYRVIGTRGGVEGRVHNGSVFTMSDPSGRAKSVRADKTREFSHYAEKLLANFTDVITGRAEPIISARDIRASVSLIEKCYENRRALDTPWYDAYERLTNES